MSSSLLNKLETLPVPCGRLLSFIPFRFRPGLGSTYASLKRTATRFIADPDFPRSAYILERLKKIVAYAEDQIPFYKELYQKNGFSSDSLKTLDDVQRIPIVTKSLLKTWELERRSAAVPGRFRANTGGTSGEPFYFYLSKGSNANEWAHMRLIWEKLGYRAHKLYLSIVGRTIKDLDVKLVCYDALRNRFLFNMYADYRDSTDALLRLARKTPIEFLHGYPGSIGDYARFCATLPPEELNVIKRRLKGVFLCSEYPAPLYRDVIESVFGVPSVSWYGHSERIVLAYEREEKFVYNPFQTYGYTEAVQQEDGRYHLVGTSYDNEASPFIRYDTEDFIEPTRYDQNGILEAFRIVEARSSDFVVDKKGQNISLTALFFGRHHPVCQFANHVQIEQKEPGKATMYVATSKELKESELAQYFNLEGIDIDFAFKLVAKPFRTAIGKTPLLIKPTMKQA